MLLGSRRPLPNATAPALGYVTTCAAIGTAGLTLFGRAESVASTIGRFIQRDGRRSAHRPGSQEPAQRSRSRRAAAHVNGIVSSMSPRAFGFRMALFPVRI